MQEKLGDLKTISFYSIKWFLICGLGLYKEARIAWINLGTFDSVVEKILLLGKGKEPGFYTNV